MITNFFIPTTKNNHKPFLLRKIAIVAYSFVLIFVNTFGAFVGLSEVQASTITPANIISLTNQERVGMGLNSLSTNSKLSAAALAKANNMFEEQYWDHFGPNGESPWQFIREAGYTYVYAGENLAKGFKTAEGVHEAWMASPTHKANIVSGNYKDIGVAVVEGVLLGKQTILVVQMFGNLTSEVYGATEEVVEPAPTPEASPEEKVVVRKEVGEIKSIRITAPQEGSVITDPGIDIEGETTGMTGSYDVDIYQGEDLVGSTSAESKEWKFDKGSDWSEGDHSVKANIKGTSVYSDTVGFEVDSKAPVVILESIGVTKGDNTYEVYFEIQGVYESVDLVLGSEIKEIEFEEVGSGIKFVLDEEEVKGSVIIVLGDESGNTSELDISEYFEEEGEQKTIFPTIVLSTTDTISIGIVSFVLLLMIIEVIVYWKRGRLKDVISDMFAIGAWWLIISIAMFSGYSGLIS